jgi:hypothetical protein
MEGWGGGEAQGVADPKKLITKALRYFFNSELFLIDNI